MNTKQDNAPRVRLAKDVDLSKAKKTCTRCNGSGLRGVRQIEDPSNKGQLVEVPVVCRCVTRGGGVKKDQLDIMLEKMSQEMNDGSFAKKLASDIMGLPATEQSGAILQLKKKAADKEASAEARQASLDALRLLLN